MSGTMANAGMGQYHRQAIYGHKGTLVIEGNQVLNYPESYPELRPRGQRARQKPNAPAEIGYQIITAIKLGVLAYREGKTKFFDPATQKMVEKPAARPEYQGDGKNHTVEELGHKLSSL
jgi:hypothetical protein